MTNREEGIIAFTKLTKKSLEEASPLSKFLINNFDRNTMFNLPLNIFIVDLISCYLHIWEPTDITILFYFIQKYNIESSLGKRWLFNTSKGILNNLVNSNILIWKKISLNEGYYQLSESTYNKLYEMDKNDVLEENILKKCEGQANVLGELIHWKEVSFNVVKDNIIQKFNSWVVYYYYQDHLLKNKFENEMYIDYFR